MTPEIVDAVLASAHAVGVVADGPDFRALCVCGQWVGRPHLTPQEAGRDRCEIEIAEQIGKARLARFLERLQSAA